MTKLVAKLRLLGASHEMRNGYENLSVKDRQDFIDYAMQDPAVRNALTVLMMIDSLIPDSEVEGLEEE